MQKYYVVFEGNNLRVSKKARDLEGYNFGGLGSQQVKLSEEQKQILRDAGFSNFDMASRAEGGPISLKAYAHTYSKLEVEDFLLKFK